MNTRDPLIMNFLQDENYSINEFGEVITCVSKYGRKTPLWRRKPQKITYHNRCYIKYKYSELAVHRIVYAKYCGILDGSLVINHIDSNPRNNHYKNLELVTTAANNLHAFRSNHRAPSGGHAKISMEQAERIRNLAREGLTYKKIMEEFPLAKSTISYIVNNRTWKSLSGAVV